MAGGMLHDVFVRLFNDDLDDGAGVCPNCVQVAPETKNGG